MDISTALEASHSVLSYDELKEYCGAMFSDERLDNLIQRGEVKEVIGFPKVYWYVPSSKRKKRSKSNIQMPMESMQFTKITLIKQIDELRQKLNSISHEVDYLLLRKDEFPTQEQLNLHMQRLHNYNETKDIGQTILGILSEIEHKKLYDLHLEYSLQTSD